MSELQGNNLATGQKSPDCLNEEQNPVADSYLCNASHIYSCLNEVYMTDRNEFGRFLKGMSPWNKGLTGYRTKPHTEETKRKIGDAHKGLKHTEEAKQKMSQNAATRRPEVRKKISEANKGRAPWTEGKHHSNETRMKISEVLKGRTAWNKGVTGYHTIPHTEEHKKKISEANKGRKHSEEIKKKMSIAKKGKHYSTKTEFKKGDIPPNKGKKHSEESKQNMSAAHKGRHLGEENPNWKGGISYEPYCSKFNKELREIIRERDGRTCQLCGIKENGHRLSVHHIHYDKHNCNPDLIALCIKCNGIVNFNREYWEEYFMNRLKERGIIV